MRKYFCIIILFYFLFSCEGVNQNFLEVDESKFTIEYGCFGIPTCVKLDEERRLVWRISTGEIVGFCLDCSGYTYFLTTFYDFIYADYDQCDQFWEDIENEAGMLDKVNNFCIEFPENCIEMYPEQCNQPE